MTNETHNQEHFANLPPARKLEVGAHLAAEAILEASTGQQRQEFIEDLHDTLGAVGVSASDMCTRSIGHVLAERPPRNRETVMIHMAILRRHPELSALAGHVREQREKRRLD